MSDSYFTASMAAVRAALIADAGVAALIGNRVVDEPAEGIVFPYVRFGRIEVLPDDTDLTRSAIVQMGLDVHSRPIAGRIEAARICEAIETALHRATGSVSVAGFSLVEIEVQTWTVERQADGATYEGRLALEISLDA
ncbi:DUF3168 domain-containing protein [Roseicyclus sp.]|uniref:DUF3168 domain-containing protein n=1 Tax=Roseicyclus sp. TaxID=1914329 RepID=UPI003F6C9CFE